MPIEKSKIIVIMGPTSSGKSDVAIKLARKFNGEIISADSRQVYKGMNLGTGKVDGIWNMKHETFISETIPHHLIDVAEPNEDFNISHFKTLTNKAIEEIIARGKLPIICGGTGFWIEAITNNTNLPEVAPNPELRAILEKKSLEQLFAELEKLDRRRAGTIDRQNKYRLVRALEIVEKLGEVPRINTKTCHPEFISGPKGASEVLKQVQNDNEKYDFLQIGLSVPREALNEKIKKRLEARFEDEMVKEVENLHENGVSWERLEYFGLEYRWIARFLQGKIEIKEMQEKLYFDIIHYAKRQMTWFKRNKKIIWLENYESIEKEVEKIL